MCIGETSRQTDGRRSSSSSRRTNTSSSSTHTQLTDTHTPSSSTAVPLDREEVTVRQTAIDAAAEAAVAALREEELPYQPARWRALFIMRTSPPRQGEFLKHVSKQTESGQGFRFPASAAIRFHMIRSVLSGLLGNRRAWSFASSIAGH